MIAELIRRKANKLPVVWLIRLGNFWSPFRGAGIKIVHATPDYRHMVVQMKLKWFNRNYVGTHFGGSLYAMTDPFYMMMFINNLGPDYIVWDKSARIDFLKPGRGTVTVHFTLSEELVSEVKQNADTLGKTVFELPVEIKDENNEIVAKVNKTIYVRKKSQVKSRDGI